MRADKSRWPKRKSKSSAPFSHPTESQFKSLESPLAQAREKQAVDHGPYRCCQAITFPHPLSSIGFLLASHPSKYPCANYNPEQEAVTASKILKSLTKDWKRLSIFIVDLCDQTT